MLSKWLLFFICTFNFICILMTNDQLNSKLFPTTTINESFHFMYKHTRNFLHEDIFEVFRSLSLPRIFVWISKFGSGPGIGNVINLKRKLSLQLLFDHRIQSEWKWLHFKWWCLHLYRHYFMEIVKYSTQSEQYELSWFCDSFNFFKLN